MTIDDRIAKALKALAHRSGKSFKQVVNETLQKGLLAGEGRKPRPYRRACGVVDLIDQARRQLYELALFIGAVRIGLDIEIGQHA